MITVITVVFNNRDGFVRTADSLRQQVGAAWEWVVIDGSSMDGTVSEIEARKDMIAYWASERDKGIYDAMNKGLQQSRGDFVVFMNSGDRFAGPDSLAIVEKLISKSAPDLAMVLGAARFELTPDFSYVQPPRPMDPYIRHSVPTSHQAMYFKTSLHQETLFDLTYRIAADYDAIARMFVKNQQVAYTDEVIADVWRGLESNSIRHPLSNILDMAKTQRKVLKLSYVEIARSAVKRSLPPFAFRLMSNRFTAPIAGRLIAWLRPANNRDQPGHHDLASRDG